MAVPEWNTQSCPYERFYGSQNEAAAIQTLLSLKFAAWEKCATTLDFS
jgi:hypothetical protein